MKPLKFNRSEKQYERELRAFLVEQGWHVEKSHGNLYQSGWPDLFCLHEEHGQRWIEVKRPKGKLKPSQIEKFRLWTKFGVGIWVLTGPKDYKKLFQPPNWWQWMDFRHRRAL